MATVNLPATLNGSSPSYVSPAIRMVPGDYWPQAIAGTGMSTSGQPAISYSWGGTQDIPNITAHSYIDLAFDLSGQDGTYSEASITMTCTNTFSMNQFLTDDAGGMALVAQNEAYRTNANLTTSNYHAIYQGTSTEIANRIGFMTAIGGGTLTFNLNAAGLTYLNNVATRGTLANYAFFGICFGGIIDGLEPFNLFMSGSQVGGIVTAATLNLTSSAAFGQINVGDSWKEIEEVKVNIGDSWRDADEWNLNIGDDWKPSE